jgi:hypothetical protein
MAESVAVDTKDFNTLCFIFFNDNALLRLFFCAFVRGLFLSLYLQQGHTNLFDLRNIPQVLHRFRPNA